jgi:hypothetical protein
VREHEVDGCLFGGVFLADGVEVFRHEGVAGYVDAVAGGEFGGVVGVGAGAEFEDEACRWGDLESKKGKRVSKVRVSSRGSLVGCLSRVVLTALAILFNSPTTALLGTCLPGMPVIRSSGRLGPPVPPISTRPVSKGARAETFVKDSLPLLVSWVCA